MNEEENFFLIQYYGNVETGMLPRSGCSELAVAVSTYVHVPFCRKKPGTFGEMVSPKPRIFRNFWGNAPTLKSQKFRDFLGFWSLWLFEISRKSHRKGEMMNEAEK